MSKSVRVLMLGPAKTFVEECAATVRLQHEVVLVHPSPTASSTVYSEPLTDQATMLGAPRLAGPGRLVAPVRLAAKRRAFSQILAEVTKRLGHVDLIHAHFYPDADVARMAAKHFGIPLIVTEHSTSFAGKASGKPLSPASERRARAIYSDCTAVIAVSTFLKQKMAEHKVTSEITVVPNPVVAGHVPSTLAQTRPRTIAFVGRLDPVKRPAMLLRALAQTTSDEVQTLHMVGDGRLRGQLESLALDLGLANRVRWHGWLGRRDVMEVLSSVSISSTASAVETFGVNLAESLMVGTPVVAFATGSIPEIVRDDGVLVEEETPDALAQGVRSGLARSRTIDRVALSERSIARWSDAAVLPRLLDVYDIALHRK